MDEMQRFSRFRDDFDVFLAMQRDRIANTLARETESERLNTGRVHAQHATNIVAFRTMPERWNA